MDKTQFQNRNACSGNLSYLFILPDGHVTICEELYWHPKFILGNINKRTIKDIWNSTPATNLFYIKQEDIPEDSKCSECQDFYECKKIKHVCWKEVIRTYGAEKWYYPDPDCPFAPEIAHKKMVYHNF